MGRTRDIIEPLINIYRSLTGISITCSLSFFSGLMFAPWSNGFKIFLSSWILYEAVLLPMKYKNSISKNSNLKSSMSRNYSKLILDEFLIIAFAVAGFSLGRILLKDSCPWSMKKKDPLYVNNNEKESKIWTYPSNF